MSARFKFRTAVTILLWVAALGVLAENAVLLRQNQRLRTAAAPEITAGTQLYMVSGSSLDGQFEPVSLSAGASKLLIITFSPGCPTCQANQKTWMTLADALRRNGMRVLWISRDPIDITRDYCLTHGIPLSETLADPSHRTYVQLGLARVPNTLLVGNGGKVEKVWVGLLNAAVADSVIAYVGERQPAPAARSRVETPTALCGPEPADKLSTGCR